MQALYLLQVFSPGMESFFKNFFTANLAGIREPRRFTKFKMPPHSKQFAAAFFYRTLSGVMGKSRMRFPVA